MFPPSPLSPPRPPGQHDILGSHPLTLWPPQGLLPGRWIPASCRPTTPLRTTHGTTCTCSHVTTPTALLTRVHPSPCHHIGEGPRRPRERPGGDPVAIMCPDGQPRPVCNSTSGRPVWPTPHFWLDTHPDPASAPHAAPPSTMALLGRSPLPMNSDLPPLVGVPVSSPKSQEKMQLLCPQAGIMGTERQRSLDAWVSAGASSQPASGDKHLHLETVTENDSPVCLSVSHCSWGALLGSAS